MALGLSSALTGISNLFGSGKKKSGEKMASAIV